MVLQRHDVNGNPNGKSNQYPVLDTPLYEVEFPGGEIKWFVAKIIAELLYAQYDVDRNFCYTCLLITEKMIWLSV